MQLKSCRRFICQEGMLIIIWQAIAATKTYIISYRLRSYFTILLPVSKVKIIAPSSFTGGRQAETLMHQVVHSFEGRWFFTFIAVNAKLVLLISRCKILFSLRHAWSNSMAVRVQVEKPSICVAPLFTRTKTASPSSKKHDR